MCCSSPDSNLNVVDVENILKEIVPILSDAHKKTPVGPRISKLEILETFIKNPNFKIYEPYIVQHILPILLERYTDKPNVVD